MEVHFTPEQEKRITRIAANAGTDAERLVKDAALRLLNEQPAGSPFPPAASSKRCGPCARALNRTPTG
jgi:hypothetical protein